MNKYIGREKEIWRCIKQSDSVIIGRKWMIALFSKELCNYLLTAKEITVQGDAKLYDWRPDLKACNQVTSRFDNRFKASDKDVTLKGVRLV